MQGLFKAHGQFSRQIQIQGLFKALLQIQGLFKPVRTLKLYSEQQSAVRTDSETTDWFSVSKGIRQRCIMSTQLLSVYTESIMREVKEEQSNSEYDDLSVGGTSTKPEGLNNLVQAVNQHSASYKCCYNKDHGTR